MRKDRLPKGFSTPPSFYSHLPWPDGVKQTLQVIIDHTYGRRTVCPLSVANIAQIRGKCRQTISLHLAFLEHYGQVRFSLIKRGDSRCREIVLCFRERDKDLRVATEKQIAGLSDDALLVTTMQQFKERRRKALVKEDRAEYVA